MQPADGVEIFPDAERGIHCTFRHQSDNRPAGATVPWRSGKLCLNRPIANLDRANWHDEPTDVVPRILWNAHRLLQWINVAAASELAVEGEINELPARAGQRSKATVAFDEREEDLADWAQCPDDWGLASLTPLQAAYQTSFISDFFGPNGMELRKPRQPRALGASKTSIRAIWVRLPAFPVVPPWNVPATWRELAAVLSSQGLDIATILEEAGKSFRRSMDLSADHVLLLGFPFAERIGSPPERLHWLAIGMVPLASRTERRSGFRPIEQNRRAWDRAIAASTDTLRWRKTVNTSPDQIRRRGAAEAAVTGSKVLILGAGSLGSAIAECLLRMGVTDLAIMDDDVLEFGNLTRHALTMRELGHLKATALADHLNRCMPDANVKPITMDFPPKPINGKIEDLRRYQVIVDCTASDTVLSDMAGFDWQEEKLFVSLAMTWNLDGLLAYSASEASFPAIDARERFAATPAPSVEASMGHADAIGCWNPVFPGTQDDILLWAGLGARFVRNAILERERRCTYWRRAASGGIEVIDV